MAVKSYGKVRYCLVGITLMVYLLITSACSIKSVKSVKTMYLDDFEKLDLVDLTKYRNPNNIRKFCKEINFLKEKMKKESKLHSKEDKQKMVNTIKSITAEMVRYILAINVTHKSKPYLFIPPRTKITLSLNTYCLSPSSAAPESDEPYILIHEDPKIPLYREIMGFTHINRSVSKYLKQSLFWNLKNKVKFEDLPLGQKTLLLRVDSKAYLKVNSYLKESVKKRVGGLITKLTPSSINKLKKVVNIVEGTVYDYKEYANVVENLHSKYTKPKNTNPIKSKDGEIYTLISTQGFSKAKVTFINPTDEFQIINSYFSSLRKDVQPLGFDIPYNEKIELAKIELAIALVQDYIELLENADTLAPYEELYSQEDKDECAEALEKVLKDLGIVSREVDLTLQYFDWLGLSTEGARLAHKGSVVLSVLSDGFNIYHGYKNKDWSRTIKGGIGLASLITPETAAAWSVIAIKGGDDFVADFIIGFPKDIKSIIKKTKKDLKEDWHHLFDKEELEFPDIDY